MIIILVTFFDSEDIKTKFLVIEDNKAFSDLICKNLQWLVMMYILYSTDGNIELLQGGEHFDMAILISCSLETMF
jgi:hypothetical protein